MYTAFEIFDNVYFLDLVMQILVHLNNFFRDFFKYIFQNTLITRGKLKCINYDLAGLLTFSSFVQFSLARLTHPPSIPGSISTRIKCHTN